MQKFVLTTAAALALSTGAALAASPDPTATSVAPAIQGQAAVSAYSGYYSGYVYPNERLADGRAVYGASDRAAAGTWRFLSRLSVSAGRGRR